MDEFKNYIEDFLDYLLIDKKYSPNTIESYARDLEKYYIFQKQRNVKINQIKKEDIKEYLKYLKESKMSDKSKLNNEWSNLTEGVYHSTIYFNVVSDL